MENTKLYTLFASFSHPELLQIRHFIHSPYHNRLESVSQLFAFLVELRPEAPTKEAVFAHLFPGDTYDAAKLRHINSYLLQTLEDYLVFRQIKGQPRVYAEQLLKGYQARSLDKNFEARLRASMKLQAKAPVPNADFHLRNYHLQVAAYAHTAARDPKGIHPNLQSLSTELDHFYVLSKLKHACNILNHEKLYKAKYDTGLLAEVIEYVERQQLWKMPTIGIYYRTFMTLRDTDADEHFQELARLIVEFPNVFELEEMLTIWLLAINFCIKKLNTGQGVYLKEVFRLYQHGLDAGILLVNGELSPFTYGNIVSAGLKIQAFEWTHTFIEEYKTKLPKENAQDFYTYSLGKYFFAKQEFRQVIRLLRPIYFSDLFIHLDAKVTLIKAYYEADEFQDIEYLLDSFKHFLRRKELLTYHKKNYTQFSRLCGRLMRLEPGKKVAVDKLREEITSAEILTDREWLLEKLAAQ